MGREQNRPRLGPGLRCPTNRGWPGSVRSGPLGPSADKKKKKSRWPSVFLAAGPRVCNREVWPSFTFSRWPFRAPSPGSCPVALRAAPPRARASRSGPFFVWRATPAAGLFSCFLAGFRRPWPDLGFFARSRPPHRKSSAAPPVLNAKKSAPIVIDVRVSSRPKRHGKGNSHHTGRRFRARTLQRNRPKAARCASQHLPPRPPPPALPWPPGSPWVASVHPTCPFLMLPPAIAGGARAYDFGRAALFTAPGRVRPLRPYGRPKPIAPLCAQPSGTTHTAFFRRKRPFRRPAHEPRASH